MARRLVPSSHAQRTGKRRAGAQERLVTTMLIHGGRRRRSSGFERAAPAPGAHTVECELVLLLAGTQSSRRARSDEAVALLRQIDPLRLSGLLDRLHVKVLLGQRLLALGHDVDPWLDNEIAAATDIGRQQGRAHELVTLGLLAGLEKAGIRSLPLKGSSLAQELYGDVGARTAGDIDVLVPRRPRSPAIAVVSEMGWRWNQQVSRAAEMPLLHETFTHPTLPRVDVHWRVHWYERRFAADALARAEQPGPHQPLVLQPADGLAALILFYARDGFSGLRMAADVAAWWDTRCAGHDANAMLAECDRQLRGVGRAAAGWGAASWISGGAAGEPRGCPVSMEGGRRAGDSLLRSGLAQIGANTSLIDVLLAPSRGMADALRRERQKIPEGLERPLTRQRRTGRPPGAFRTPAAHVPYDGCLVSVPAVARAAAGGTGPRPRPY